MYPGDIIKGDSIKAASAICTLVGALFSFVLAFVLLNVWQEYQDQKKRLVLEACTLGNFYRESGGLNKEIGAKMQGFLKQYTYLLVEDAWPLLDEGKESRRAWECFNELYKTTIVYKPLDSHEGIIYGRIIDHLNELSNYRRLRLLSSQKANVPPVFWVILIIGAFFSVGFTYFFRIGTILTHGIMTAIHGAIIGLLILLTLLLNSPFSGGLKIEPQPLIKLLKDIYPSAEKAEHFVYKEQLSLI